jgi:DNA processing protein
VKNTSSKAEIADCAPNQTIMNYDILKYWIALKSIAGVGNITFPALVDKFGSLPAIFVAPVSELRETPGISKNTSTAIAGFKDWDKVKEELELLDKKKLI